MKHLNILAVLFLSTIARAQSPVFMNCATSSTIFQVSTFTLEPYPPCLSSEVCFVASGQLTAPIVSGATVRATIRAPGQIIIGDPLDLCAILSLQGHFCPTQTLPALVICTTIGPSVPANTALVATLSATNGDGKAILCQQATGVIAVNC